jgi:hypothetical protein
MKKLELLLFPSLPLRCTAESRALARLKFGLRQIPASGGVAAGARAFVLRRALSCVFQTPSFPIHTHPSLATSIRASYASCVTLAGPWPVLLLLQHTQHTPSLLSRERVPPSL